jgi:hypothetical protein
MPPTTLIVDLSEEELRHISRLIEGQNQTMEAVDGEFVGNTHGKLDLTTLATMLLEDVALADRRPGSWEGANMLQLLSSHGYN